MHCIVIPNTLMCVRSHYRMFSIFYDSIFCRRYFLWVICSCCYRALCSWGSSTSCRNCPTVARCSYWQRSSTDTRPRWRCSKWGCRWQHRGQQYQHLQHRASNANTCKDSNGFEGFTKLLVYNTGLISTTVKHQGNRNWFISYTCMLSLVLSC